MNTTRSHNFSSNQNDSIAQEKGGNHFLLLTTIANILVITICLLYVNLKLKLDKYIKAILCTMAIQNLIGSFVMTVTNIFMILSDSKSYLVCLSLSQSSVVIVGSISTMTPLISFMRYTMASKASKVLDKLFYHSIFCLFFFNRSLSKGKKVGIPSLGILL